MTEYCQGVPLHPINKIFPMMPDEELEGLAESITAHGGLIYPVVLDKNGTLLDGKCRLRACAIAGVAPTFKTFEGADDECEAFILSMNLYRQNLNPSQRAIAEACLVEPGCYWEHRILPEARAVAQHPDLVGMIMAGTRSLSDAYDRVLERNENAARHAEQHRRLIEFRKTEPYWAMKVDEGTLTFDQALAASRAPVLAEHAEAIRHLGKQMVADAIEIGLRLSECKQLLGHGNWLPWLDHEFQWSERTALNFMRIHELSLKSANVADLDLPASALYLLAAPSTPEAVRADILARADAGEAFSVADVRRAIGRERSTKPARDLLQDLRDLIAKLSRERPDDPLVEQLRTLVIEPENPSTS
jgi:hypothetical protein